MAIDFSLAECQTVTNETVFCIKDIPPARLVFNDSDEWDVWVNNNDAKEITHTAIDICLDIPQYEGFRCDSMLTYENVIIFVELKDRYSSGWLAKALDQLKNTKLLFERDGNLADFTKRFCHIANKQKPNFSVGKMALIDKFEEETGFIVRSSLVIEIE